LEGNSVELDELFLRGRGQRKRKRWGVMLEKSSHSVVEPGSSIKGLSVGDVRSMTTAHLAILRTVKDKAKDEPGRTGNRD
jgi:hypothetical protein